MQDHNIDENKLIQKALQGDKKSLEELIRTHQNWIYNVALNFLGDKDEASDLTQEILIKLLTKLSTFKGESKFRTWLYRIIKNHFLNMKRSKYEISTTSFKQFGEGLDQIPDEPLNNCSSEVEDKLLVKEAKLSCMKGMLLCLDREQRLIFIMGELFEFKDSECAEIMGISRENFRVKLHRAKKQLYTFMDQKCGLINTNNPCRCANKTKTFIKMGCVDPVNLHFQKSVIDSIENVLEKKVDQFSNDVHDKYQRLYQTHYFLEGPESIKCILDMIESDEVRDTFNLK